MRRVLDALALISSSKAASVKKHDDSGSAGSGGNVGNGSTRRRARQVAINVKMNA
jgi:hypothetical protein